MAEQIMKRKIYLTYSAKLIKEAVICDMYDKLKVRFNIRSASVSDAVGIIALELEGTSTQIQAAIDYFKRRGVTVEPIEQDIIEG